MRKINWEALRWFVYLFVGSALIAVLWASMEEPGKNPVQRFSRLFFVTIVIFAAIWWVIYTFVSLVRRLFRIDEIASLLEESRDELRKLNSKKEG